MSIAALNWAWTQECPNATSKLVLLALADKANEEGECWPGMGTVADMAGVSSRQVSTHLSRLENSGLIVRRRRRTKLGRLGPYVFHLNMSTGSLLPVDQGKPTSGSTPPVDQRKSASGSQPPVGAPTTGSPASSTTGSPLPDKGHPSKSNPHKPSRRRKPEAPLPADWSPSVDHRTLARDQGVDCDHEAAKFRDHAAANDRRQRDWDASFRTWLRRARDYGARKPANAAITPPPGQADDDWTDGWDGPIAAGGDG